MVPNLPQKEQSCYKLDETSMGAHPEAATASYLDVEQPLNEFGSGASRTTTHHLPSAVSRLSGRIKQ